jgi:hypothetical protein
METISQFFTQITPLEAESHQHIGFQEKTPIFCRELAKVA